MAQWITQATGNIGNYLKVVPKSVTGWYNDM